MKSTAITGFAARAGFGRYWLALIALSLTIVGCGDSGKVTRVGPDNVNEIAKNAAPAGIPPAAPPPIAAPAAPAAPAGGAPAAAPAVAAAGDQASSPKSRAAKKRDKGPKSDAGGSLQDVELGKGENVFAVLPPSAPSGTPFAINGTGAAANVDHFAFIPGKPKVDSTSFAFANGAGKPRADASPD